MSDRNNQRWSVCRNLFLGAAPVGLLGSLFLAMAWWSWRKWPDILVDFGRELYLPWQIADGQIFYRDVVHLFGPFSAHLNALLFRLFGVSFSVVVLANLAILAGMLAVVYDFLHRACSRMTAFAGCALIILVFAFSQYVVVGNYNFVSPYAHEATHGIVLSVVMLHQLWRFSVERSRKQWIVAAIAFGCTFLTKAEIFTSASLALVSFFVLMSRDPRRPENLPLLAAKFMLVAFVPTAAFGIYFSVQMPPGDAWRALWLPYSILLNTDLVGTTFYKEGMGLDNIGRHSVEMFFQAVFFLAVIAVAMLLSRWHTRSTDRPIQRAMCTAGLMGVITTALLTRVYSIGFCLPVLTALSAGVFLKDYLQSAAADSTQKDHLLALFTWAVFSLSLQGKILFNSILYHYGFYLSMPAVVLICIMLVWYLPTWLDVRQAGGATFQKAMLIMLAVLAGQYLYVGNQYYRVKNLPVGSDQDRVITYDAGIDPRGPAVRKALSWLKLHLDQNETFLAVPEGIMLNYLSKKVNPTRYTNMMPPEMLVFGEKAMLEEIKADPPDYCLVVHNNPAGYGVGFFGEDPNYGRQIMGWIRQNYRQVKLIGSEPLKDDRFGIRILKRNIAAN